MLLSLLFTLAVVSIVPSLGQLLGELSISFRTRTCDRSVPVSKQQCPMAYSLVFSGGIESPYYNICNDDALGEASVDEVVRMNIETDGGDVITCRNAHACVGCPALASLLESCRDGDGLGATHGNSNKRKRRSPGSAKRKRSSDPDQCVAECDQIWVECESICRSEVEIGEICDIDCGEALDKCVSVCRDF